jgi:filamentous hemagglutinin
MMFTHLYRQSISCILSTVLLGNTLYAGGIVVDTAAAASHQATMDTTPNGIPLINIVTPNTSGLSHNKFSEFNIEQRGVIFNNATSAALTQLGGWVQGNANLGTTPARVILNEVTGTNRTLLRGYGEIAGHSADLIIANPNGITMNGGGFINTPRATLTTGTPILNGDTLSGFHVQRGDILIEGSGVNADNIDRVDFYTKALQLNAQIHAKGLDVVTGEHTIGLDGTVTSDNVVGSEPFSIDSSALGGIYADTIRLIGTDKGVGVNLPQITYASDSLSLSADGHIILGSAYATNKIDVSSTQDAITLTTDIATDTLTLIASKSLLNTGDISANNASIHADNLTNETSATLAAQIFDATLGTSITNNGILMSQTASIAAQELHNNGSMVTNQVELNIDHLLSNNGLLSAYTQMGIHASDMSGGVNAEIVAKNLTITLSNSFSNEGTIGAETMNLSTGSFLNRGDIYTDTIDILSNQILQNTGILSSSLSATIEAKSLTNTSGAAISSTALNMNVEEDITNAGSIITHDGGINADNLANSGNLIVDITNLHLLHSLTNTGVISGSEKITVHALNITNRASAEITAKEMEIVLNGDVSNSGSFTSDTVLLKAHNLTNTGEVYGSVMNMELANSITNQGTLSASTELDLLTASLTNQNGAILEALTLNAEATLGMNNQGMIRASTLSLTTPTLTNDATILADTLAIEATNVTNNALLKGSDSANITVNNTITNNGGIIGGNQLAIHADTITNNEMLYSTNSIDLSASNTLRNSEGSMIKSAGSITIHDTGALRNEAARIEADGDISIRATTMENLSNKIPTLTTHYNEYIEGFVIYRHWLDSIDKTGYIPSYILAGGDMLIDAAIHNRYSMIAVNKNLYLSGSLNNEASLNAYNRTEEAHMQCNYLWDCFLRIEGETSIFIDHANSTIQAGGSIYGNLASINNADVVSGSFITAFTSQSVDSSSVGSITHQNRTYGATDIFSHNIVYQLPDGKYGEFVRVSNPSLPYLIETNPLYTDYNVFISSDYMMSKLGINMDANTKRLGDARYETQLIRDAVFRLTGEHYLAGFGSDTAQYQALMDNALAVSSDLHLEFGISLSASQISALNRDIVWMEDKVVSGQHVLVPVVYLASLTTAKLSGGGKIIAGDSINLAVSGDVSNSGDIRASQNIAIDAKSITNNVGTLSSSGTTLLSATDNIINKNGGRISGKDVGILSREGSVINETFAKTTTVGTANRNFTRTLVGEKSTIQATDGNLIVQSQNDIKNIGADMSAVQSIALATQEGNIDFKTKTLESGHNINFSGGFDKAKDIKYLSSSANAGEHIIMQSGGDINLESSKLAAGGTVTLNAGENVNLTALNDVHYKDVQTSKKGSFGSSKTTRDMIYKESVVGSEIDAENIVINSGKDTTLQAANLKAAENIQVDAAGDINVLAAAYREGELHYSKKKGFGGLSSSISLDQTDALKLREATVKTEAKNIIMNSGKDINIIASEVNSAADVQLKAFENLNIVAGEEVKSEKHESQKSSFNPLGLLSLVGIDAGPIYTQDIHNKDNYDTTAKSSAIKAGGNIVADTGTTNIVGSNLNAAGDVTIKADIGGINVAFAQELHNASSLNKKVEVKLTDVFTSSVDAFKNLNTLNDTKLKFNVASATFDESTTTAQSVTNVAASITSGKNVTLDSSDDLTIKGSNVIADDTIDLKSKTGNIAITESVDTTNTNTKEKHATADVNLVVQNEYVETGVAVKNAIEAAEQLKQTKEDYSNYKRELKKLEASLDTLKKDPQVSESDIANLQGLIAATKDDEAYYIAAIAAATVNLASKSVAVAQQAEAAGASTATAGFSAGLSLDIQGSQSDTSSTATRSNASNLNASNINIATDNAKDTSVTVSGSNVNASDTLNIDTHDLNVIASTDTATTNSSSKDISGSISMTVYGAPSGPQVSMGYGQNESRSSSTTHTNSTLTGNTVNIDATNDATFKGATVRADETLNVNVGNNLEIASVQDTSSSSNHGMNISGGFGFGSDSADTSSNPDAATRKVEQGKLNQRVGIRTGNGTIASVNGGIGASNGRSYDTQIVLTSLTGDSVNVTTGKNTKLSGAVIAATDTNGNDTGKLGLTTQTLTTENLTDTHYNSQSGFSVGANIGLTPTAKDTKPDTKNTQTPSGTKLNSEHLAFNTSRDVSVGKTLATVGEGNLNIGDTQNSSDTTNLNRDVTKVDKELYSSSTGTKVDATIDNRMFTEDGQKEIKQQYKDMDKNMKAVSETLPNATSDNPAEAALGKLWDNVAAYATLGVLPSHGNNGGVLGEIPILTGNKDSVQKMLQVVSKNAPLYQKALNTFIPIEQSDAYKMMSEEQQAKVAGLYISKDPVTITKESATYQNGDNGIMNDKGLAVANVLEQTGQSNKSETVEATVFYNPSRGMVADSVETLVDLFGGTTGIAKQYGEFVRDTTTARGNDGSNFTQHSQGNALLYSGINYINSSEYTGAKFLSADKFIKDNGDKSGIPTFVSFGSPVNGETMRDLISADSSKGGLGYTYMGAFTKKYDGVGELLGANNGINEGSVSPLYRFNPAVILYDSALLLTPWSPHSGYDPYQYEALKNVVGYKK